MNDSQEPHQRSRRSLGWELCEMAAGVCQRPVRVPLRALGEISIMTNSTRLIGLVMTAALWAGVAAAQGLTGAGSGDDLPPDLTVPSQDVEASASASRDKLAMRRCFADRTRPHRPIRPTDTTKAKTAIRIYQTCAACGPSSRRSKAPALGCDAAFGMPRPTLSSTTGCGIAKISDSPPKM